MSNAKTNVPVDMKEVLAALIEQNNALSQSIVSMRESFGEQLRQDRADTLAMIKQMAVTQQSTTSDGSKIPVIDPVLRKKMATINDRHYWGGEMLDVLRDYSNLVGLSQEQHDSVKPEAIFDLLLQYGKPL